MMGCDYQNTGSLGAARELLACAVLVSHGYAVFRNVGPHGTDLVVDAGGELLRVEVKTASPTTSKNPSLMADPKADFDVLLIVSDSTVHCWGRDLRGTVPLHRVSKTQWRPVLPPERP